MQHKGKFVIVAFPDPVQDKILVAINRLSSAAGTLTLPHLTGKTIRTKDMTKTQTEMNLQGLPAGLYLLHFQDGVRTHRQYKSRGELNLFHK